MTLTLTAAAPDFSALETPLLAIALPSGPKLSDELRPIDALTNGALGRALTRRDFRGGRDETLDLAGGERGVQRVIDLLHESDQRTDISIRQPGARIVFFQLFDQPPRIVNADVKLIVRRP